MKIIAAITMAAALLLPVSGLDLHGFGGGDQTSMPCCKEIA